MWIVVSVYHFRYVRPVLPQLITSTSGTYVAIVDASDTWDLVASTTWDRHCICSIRLWLPPLYIGPILFTILSTLRLFPPNKTGHRICTFIISRIGLAQGHIPTPQEMELWDKELEPLPLSLVRDRQHWGQSWCLAII